MADRLTGKVALVSGGARGMGASHVRTMVAEGAKVVFGDILDDEGEVVAKELGDSARYVHLDVTQPEDWESAVATAVSEFGGLHVLVNNAGIINVGTIEDYALSEWQRILDINLMSVVRSNAAFLPLLLDQGSGHLVNTASFAGLFTYSYDRLPYAATKAALVQISEGLAIYLRPKNIGVTLLCPGPVLTNIAAAVPTFGGGAPLRTPGEQFGLLQPEPVGELVADAILRNRFFVPTHPRVVDELRRRVEDWDAYIDYQISREPRL